MVYLAQEHLGIPNNDILSWIFTNPPYDIDKPIFIDVADPSRSISSRHAKLLIRQIVAGLRAAGHKTGDCVCIHSFNDIYYPIFFLGIIAAGGIFAGNNPSYTQPELVHHIKTADVKFLLTEPEMLETTKKAADVCNLVSDKIWLLDYHSQKIPAGFKSFRALFTSGEEDWARFDDRNTSENTTAAYLFSSGTTGLPKAAVLSHYNLVAQHEACQGEYKRPPFERIRLACLPMFHASIAPAVHTSALKRGITNYVMRRFDVEIYLRSIEMFKITDLVTVPPIAIAILMSPNVKKYSLASIREGKCGAAPMTSETQARIQALLPDDVPFTQAFGMTETSCVATMFYYPEHDATGSIGRAIPNLDMKVIDAAGNDITAPKVPGEICVRGPTVVKSYYKNPTANAESFDSEGFFKTGDVGYCDTATGKWYIIDRKKELIKVRGFQVAPAELESALLQHPYIVDAAVIGVRSEQDGEELPRGYVVVREGEQVSEREVMEWMDGRLAGYKKLTGGLKFVEDGIPKNASGKILKRQLREDAEKERRARGAKL